MNEDEFLDLFGDRKASDFTVIIGESFSVWLEKKTGLIWFVNNTSG